jgi:hypothetical protein
MNGQPAGVLHTLLREPFDVSRKTTPRPQVQVMPGHAAINLDRASDRFSDVLDRRHEGQRVDAARVPLAPASEPSEALASV